MSKFEILWVASDEHRRDYKDRQLFANSKGAKAYIEGHCDARAYKRDTDGDGVLDADAEGTDDNPTSCLVCDNASQTSRDMAQYFSDAVSKKWGYPNRGVVELARGARGYWNLYYTDMKAILLEGWHVSDKEIATLAMSELGQDQMAQIIADMIRKFFPDGGLIAFSVGHMFKKSSIHDRGAPVAGGNGLGEADIVLSFMRKAAVLLETGANINDPEPEPVQLAMTGENHKWVEGQWEVSCYSKDGTHLKRRDV